MKNSKGSIDGGIYSFPKQKIKIPKWSNGFISFIDTKGTSQNIVIATNGTLSPRKGWKTFSGMVWQLWLINRRYNKLGVQGEYTVKLPLPVGNFKGKKRK